MKQRVYRPKNKTTLAEEIAKYHEKKLPKVMVPKKVKSPLEPKIKPAKVVRTPPIPKPAKIVRERHPVLRVAVRVRLLKMFGALCSECGYDKYVSALEFHHVEPAKKSYDISRLIAKFCSSGWDEDWRVLIDELGKCVVLCSNCHQALHNGEWALEKE